MVTVIRGTVGADGRKCGFKAMRKMMTRFNPKTPAKLFRILGEVMSPGAVKEGRDVGRAVGEWEINMSQLESVRRTMSGAMRVAVLIHMVPKDLQDIIFQMGDVIQTGESESGEHLGA